FSVSEIREHLAKELPEYMIPSYFVQMDNIPLSQNGKADRKALPEPEGMLLGNQEYTAPGNDTERQLAEIWQELLVSERIGINNSFFELGGDSLKAMKLAYRIRKKFGMELSVKEIFENQTVKQLSELINGMGAGIICSIPPAEERDYYEVTPAQRRLFFLNQLEPESTTYNLPSVIIVEGRPDVKKLTEVFGQLAERHESLRTSFEVVDDRPVQIVHQNVEIKLEYETLPEMKVDELVRNFVRPFVLHKAPLIRAKLVKQTENRHLLIYDIHHIISDGISINILTREFIALYSGVQLPQLKIQYKDYSVWMKEQLDTGLKEKQEQYWLERFSGKLPVLSMPTDYPRPEILSFEGSNSRFLLDKEMSSQLTGLARDAGTTLYSVLLAAFNILLSLYSGQEDIIIGSPVAGRTNADLEEVIGMFVNTVAMRNYPEGRKSFREFLQEVADNSLRAFDNQDYQLDELTGRLDLPRDLSRNPLFDVVFVLQKRDELLVEIDGLKFVPVRLGGSTAKFDLTLQAEETPEGLLLAFEYSTRLFTIETIEKLLRDIKKILETILKNKDVKINEILLEGAYRKGKRAISKDVEFDF
ncbi:MAG TPA: condensation domain-containing protein, partial [Clostridia bacterium]|nr:condensation domain-containing protein [Clostridia bacterium]